MEFNIRGILNENGQLQSVQSQCSHTPVDGAPFVGPFQLEGTGNQECKLVPYAVKKDLDGKLSTKMEEMSQMMLELVRVKESLNLSRKLNKEYEEKIKRYENTIRQLQEGNTRLSNLLTEHSIPIPDSERLETDLCANTIPKVPFSSTFESETSIAEQTTETKPKIIRSSMTEVTIGFRHSLIDMTDSMYSVPAQLDEKSKHPDPQMEDKNDTMEKHENLSQSSKILVNSRKPIRPSKLDVSKIFDTSNTKDNDAQRKSTQNTDISSHKDAKSTDQGFKEKTSNAECSDSINPSFYSMNNSAMDTVDRKFGAVSNDIQTVNESNHSATAKVQNSGKCNTEEPSHTPLNEEPRLPVDEDGYLVFMVPTKGHILNRNKAMRRQESKTLESSQPNVFESNNVDQCLHSQCNCGSEVHVSWIEFHSCRNSTSESPNSPLGNYVPADQHDPVQKEPMRSPPVAEACFQKAHVIVNPAKHIYTEIPDDLVDEVMNNKDTNSKKKDTTLDNTDKDDGVNRAPLPLPEGREDSNVAVRYPNYLRKSSSSELPSPDTSNLYRDSWAKKLEDQPNNVMKMMRKTFEWNTAKKTLLEKSHTCTIQDAENTLGTVVKKAIECFQTEFEKKQRRTSKNLSDRLIKMIKKSLVYRYDEDVVTTEFLEKCVQICDREFL